MEMFPILIAMGPSKETPKLPEGEDIKKEVWSQGKIVGHTNVISANLLQQYIPVVSVEEVQDLEEDVEAVPVEPQTKSCLSGPWWKTRSTTCALPTPPRRRRPGRPSRWKTPLPGQKTWRCQYQTGSRVKKPQNLKVRRNHLVRKII